MASAVPSPQTSTSTSSIWKAPQFIVDFYAKLPLIVFDQEDELSCQKGTSCKGKSKAASSIQLWVEPPTPSSSRPWPSSSPTSLRTQLLFLLRSQAPKISFKSWSNPASAPNGKLPALHLIDEGRLLGADEIRSWLDERYPINQGDGLNGMPDQAAYDKALALAQLILGNLYPAYLASLPTQPSTFHLLFPTPPPLFAGLSTPLPASITGDKRDLDIASILRNGVEAIETLDVLIGNGEGWALGAREPTPLDALIVSHLYPIYGLPRDSTLQKKLEEHQNLRKYVERVLDLAEKKLDS